MGKYRAYTAVLALFFASCFCLFADGEDSTDIPEENRFVLGAGFTWTNNPELFGGHFEAGMVLFRRILYIQNNVSLRAGGLSLPDGNYTIFTLSEKLIFGRNSAIPLKIYTYLEGGIGIYGNAGKGFFTGSFAFTLGFGGGGEISSVDFGGLYIEVGYLGQKTTAPYPVSGVIIQTGWRIFF